MFYTRIKAFIRLTRPFFLLGGVLLYLLGAAIALSRGTPFNLGRFVSGQLLVTSVQLMVHYVNEYYDRDVDRAVSQRRTWFSGGSGVLPSGGLSPVVALRAAQILAGISLALLVLVAIQSPAVGALGALVLLVGWFYSAPPLRLVSSGWGELVASIITAFCAPFMGLVLQSGLENLTPLLFVVTGPLVLIHIAMVIAFGFPDREADAAYGKRTLTVRLGLDRAAWLHDGLIAGALIIYSALSLLGYSGTAGRFVILVVPLAAWQMVRAAWHARHPDAGYQLLTLGAVSLYGLTAILWLVGFIWP